MNSQTWEALDLIGQSCARVGDSRWRGEWKQRTRQSTQLIPVDQEIMRRFVVAIAYSQGARSSIVCDLVEQPFFREAFADFDPGRLSRKRPTAILRRYWDRLGHIRFKGKVSRIVECAKVLNQVSQEFGSFAAYLRSFRIPRRLRSQKDINQFWEWFDLLKLDLEDRKMPFFRSTTSLLQLLLDLDYDSVKPDLIVMRLARRIGMVEREVGDKHLRAAARKTQEYAVSRGIRAQAVDLQMLAYGGQTGARQLLTTRFCPASDPCTNRECVVGRKGLCNAVASV